MKKFFNEFKTFISKGNVMDLAIAFIVGAAFKAIISSLVSDIIMPVVSLVVGEQGFDNFKYVITEANLLTGATENAIYYGSFIQSIIDFVIIAFVVFLMVKSINKVKAKLEKEEEKVVPVAVEAKPTTEDLLTDIKAILSEKK
ncbi:MAG: large conductance mechanosensitive channel protein MscL [Tenericutes bacterium]|nr:large conductance mechanosensitive channel protein MscL [Mycoplasmatota bacterium]